jgi:hypothetical protein
MTFWQAIKTYKKAVFWSMAISATLIMEGYDTSRKSSKRKPALNDECSETLWLCPSFARNMATL